MKQKKKKKVSNNKFNFDDEYIIGFSNSSEPSKKKIKSKKKKKKQQATTNKNIKKNIMNKPKGKFNSVLVKAFAIIILFVGAGCFLCLSPLFNVSNIVIENNKTISSDTISSLSKIQLYKNIFLIDKSRAIKNIEKNPYINSVKIERKLPDRVKITVEERKAKYSIEFAEGKYAIIDGQGYILESTSESKDLPIIVRSKYSGRKFYYN